MDAPALCDSILQFVGSGLPTQGSVSHVPVSDLADGAAGERVSEESDTSRDTTAAGSADRTGSTAASEAAEQEQQLQNQGLMRAFMGNKLGEFNMRGVEAGMGMVNVTTRKTGKLLNSGRRQRREDQSTPYGRRSSSRGEMKESMTTQAEQAGDTQGASTKVASTAIVHPGSSFGGDLGSSVGGDVESVGVDSSRSRS